MMYIHNSGKNHSLYHGNRNIQGEDTSTRRLYPGCVILCAYLCVLAAFMFDSSQRTSFFRPAAIILVTLILIGVYWYRRKKLTVGRIILLIFAASFIIKLCYVLYVPINAEEADMQHDFGEFYNGSGHAGYIQWFYENGLKLIDQDPRTLYQFYHPPLHHFIAALWVHMQTITGLGYERAIAGVQFLTLFYSCSCTFVAERIFRKIGLKRSGLVIATAVIAFHPTFVILSGSINNDILSILFIFLAVYATICWYQNPTTKNIIWIALSFGLGMMTKLSMAVLALPIALVFIIKWFKEKKIWKRYLKQYCLFLAISAPLSLWYSVRNLVKFGVPLGYVPSDSVQSDQYIGNYSLFERLFDFSDHPFRSIFLNRGADGTEHNIIVAILKTSLFGEWNLGGSFTSKIVPLCWIALVLNIILIGIALFAMVFFLIKKNRFLDGVMKLFLGGYYVLLMVQYVVFCIRYPFTCSMDFRYIVPTLLIGSLFIGILAEHIESIRGGSPRSIRDGKTKRAKV
ncbi:MAG: ArnT family glycosyltransferase [Anaerovoracaceae bacterium]|jgi:hypothetical protein